MEHYSIEDPSIRSAEDRLEIGAGRRYHQRHLRPMCGAYLTLLDEEGRILFFAGGVQRRQEEGEEQLIVLTPQSLAKGFLGNYQPEYRVLKPQIEGGRRSQFTVDVKECPFLSLRLGTIITEAIAWGVLRVGPDDGQIWLGAVPNGQNTERFLDDRTWKAVTVGGIPQNSGGNDLTVRLAPNALDYANCFPSAWQLAVSSAKLFGGMAKIPSVDPIKPSAVITSYVNHEMDSRAARKLRIEEQRMKRMAAQRAGVSHFEEEKRELQQLINPEQKAVLDTVAAGASEASGGQDQPVPDSQSAG